MIAYLSGPIENAENDGANWRESITPWLKDEIKHDVFNPVLATRKIISNLTNTQFREMKDTSPKKYKNLIRQGTDSKYSPSTTIIFHFLCKNVPTIFYY